MVSNQSEIKQKIDAQYRTLLILWIGFLPTIVLYFLVTLIQAAALTLENRLMTIIFSGVAVFLVIVSFAVRKALLTQAAQKQQPSSVTTAFIIGVALCEAAGLLGLLDYFVAHDRYYLLLLALALVGMLLHFPRRRDVEAAYFKSF